MAIQKANAKQDAQKDLSDWVELLEDPSVNFVGYDNDTIMIDG